MSAVPATSVTLGTSTIGSPPVGASWAPAITPAGSTSACSWPLARFVIGRAAPTTRSTAGAAAVWRTISRPEPLATGVVSFANGVSTALPLASRWATTVQLPELGTGNDAMGPMTTVSVPASFTSTFVSVLPANPDRSCVVPGAKPGMTTAPFT
jgi:hypothetical protein